LEVQRRKAGWSRSDVPGRTTTQAHKDVQLRRQTLVLDPFLGSGTTVLQASTRVPQKVFTVFSSGEKGEKKLHNPEVIEEIRTEIERLKSSSNFNS
jgi:hypothetical protein